MPWFKKHKSMQLKKRHRFSKKDISQPTDFKHCYHAEYDDSLQGFAGLPPQWSSLISSTNEKNQLDSPPSDSLDSTLVAVKETPEKSQSALSTPTQSHREPSVELEICIPSSQQPAEPQQEDTNNIQELTKRDSKVTPCNSTGSSKVSLASSCSLGLTKRPSPIIRGPDYASEETMKNVHKHCRSSSHGNPIERELLREALFLNRHSGQEQIAEEDFMHFNSRPRAGSYHQLRTSPINRRQIVSYTPGGPISHSTDRLPATFSMRAPNDVAKSDLGLYDCENAYDSPTAILSRINSPSESSGYFGSTRSSLNSSRMSSFQQLSSACSPNGTAMPQYSMFPPNRPVHSYQREHSDVVSSAFKFQYTNPKCSAMLDSHTIPCRVVLAKCNTVTVFSFDILDLPIIVHVLFLAS